MTPAVLSPVKWLVTTASSWVRRSGLPAAHGRILTYHRVDWVSGDRLVVSPEAFRIQMEWLSAQGIRVVDLSTLVASLSSPPPDSPQVAITFDDGYLDNFEYAWPILRGLKFPAAVFVPAGWVGQARFMSWDQLHQMAQDGITIGSHSLTHPKLSRIPLAQAREEVVRSKEILEQQLKRRVDWFCYPSGDFSDPIVQFLREAGYQGAVTVLPGANGRQTPHLALRRTEVSGEDTLESFKRKLFGAYDDWHRLVQCLKRFL